MLITDINAFYTYLQSQKTAQQFLCQSYQKMEGVNPERKSYENCNSFIYFLKHGIHFYTAGKKADPMLKPLLLFYGMSHLLKASLVANRPNYPESTKVLAHGVSSRKRKKKQYVFMNDEVKVQHFGLFPYFSEHLYGIKRPLFDKITMEFLLGLIPEMTPLFTFNGQNKLHRIGTIGDQTLEFPYPLLDQYHLTEQAFLSRITPHLPRIVSTKSDQINITVQLSKPLTNPTGPFFTHLVNQSIYFPSTREFYLPISEVMVHYLLLYNLSMLSRYETEWWGDLLMTMPEIDYPFIVHFLKETANKIPTLLGYDLYLLHQSFPKK